MTGSELEVRRQASLSEKVEWVKFMATADLLPAQYRNNPGNLLYAVEYGDSLGIDRINAITSIHVINGKPSASADLIAALVRKAGHKLRVTGDDTYAVAQIIRADDPEFVYESRWDVKKAQAAKLWGKGNWATYPAAMLKARAITEVARMGASDTLYGVVYTPEELGAQVDVEGLPTGSTTPQTGGEGGPLGEDGPPSPPPTPAEPTPSGSRDGVGAPAGGDVPPTSSPATPGGPDADGVYPAEVVEDEPTAGADPPHEPGLTEKQLTAIVVGFGKLGVVDRTEQLYTIHVLIGRQVESRKHLTFKEAGSLLDTLGMCKDRAELEAVVTRTDEARQAKGTEQ